MRKICVVTGSRAEYGLLKPLLDEVKADSQLRLQLVVTGSHLSKDFGFTLKEITKDFTIDLKVKMDLKGDKSIDTLCAMGKSLKGFGEGFMRLKPNLIVLLGDRYEILSAALAAHVLGIPLAHIHGGETTQGAFDEAFRHAITKMSYIHFTSTQEYRRRVIQLGEDPKRVFYVGAIGLDNLKKLKLLTKNELGKELNLAWKKTNILVTYHPVTLEQTSALVQIRAIFKVLDGLKDAQIIFTKANSDVQGRMINDAIQKYVKKNSARAILFESLGQVKYLSLLKCVDVMVGNSSSGIIEAASFNLPVVNIGDRQQGRVKSKNVIDVGYSQSDIKAGIMKALSIDFKDKCQNIENLYQIKGRDLVSTQIKKQLKAVGLNPKLLKKKFFDL